jgi:5-methylcytosine-specific restriction protein A
MIDQPNRDGVVEQIDLPWRKVPEWVGKTPDTPVPTAVKLRVFARYDGRCYLTGQKINAGDEWDTEHVKPLRSALPGEPHLNRESNLAPALKAAHAEKTAAENSAGAKADRIRAKHLGIWPRSKTPLKGRGFSTGRNKASTIPLKDIEQ